MLKYCVYLILCLFFGFLDFYFESRGILSLLFNLIVVFLIIISNRKSNKTKLNFKISYDNYLLYGIISIILTSILISFVEHYFYPIDSYRRIDYQFIISLVILSFVEEVIFRGHWLNQFLEKYDVKTSILVVSIGFTFLHFFARNDPFFAFVGSVILSCVFLKKKSISNVFMIHLLYNLFVLFLLPKIMLSYSNLDGIYKIIIFVIITITNVCFLKMLFKKENNKKYN